MNLMATRSRYHLPPVELLVLFVFDTDARGVWITNIASGATRRVAEGTWTLEEGPHGWSDRGMRVHVCAINPRPGVSLKLQGTSSGDYEIDAPSMFFEVAHAPRAQGMRFGLEAGGFSISIATGDAANHPEWLADLENLPVTGYPPKGPTPPKPLDDLLRGPRNLLERFMSDLLTSPPIVEHVQRLIDARVADPAGEHRPLREELASLADGRLAPTLLDR